MGSVELIYDSGCPNIKDSRSQLLRAFVQAGVNPQWKEWDRTSSESPDYVRAYGSPTILVNGTDVMGASVGQGAYADSSSCRIYNLASGQASGVPPLDAIATALIQAKSKYSRRLAPRSEKWGGFTMIPTIGVALLPKIACPACWPAYAGLLSSLGLGVLVVNSEYLLGLTAIFLTIAVGALAFRAKTRRGYWPFVLGLCAGAIVIVGKFYYESDPAMYGGLGILVAASLWNSCPKKVLNDGSCPSCVQGRVPDNSVSAEPN